MLVLCFKASHDIQIGDSVVRVLKTGSTIRLAVSAPADVDIRRIDPCQAEELIHENKKSRTLALQAG